MIVTEKQVAEYLSVKLCVFESNEAKIQYEVTLPILETATLLAITSKLSVPSIFVRLWENSGMSS